MRDTGLAVPFFKSLLILPTGTQVVARVATSTDGHQHSAGAVGIIIESPVDATHAYRVRFPDGTEANLRRSELAIRKHFQASGIQTGPAEEWDLHHFVIYRCIVGSKAYGLAGEESDIDRRGIYLPPARMQWSLYGVSEQLEDRDNEEVYWELQKFLVLALKANPNVLECLYTPMVEMASPIAKELLAIRAIFLSKLVYQTYNGYVLSQFRLLERDLRTKGAVKWKHAMHLVRLLLSGITTLREGFVPLDVAAHRERLLAIRCGSVPWDEVDAWRLQLHRAFDEAFERTPLPERPDYERANDFLIVARRSMVDE